ncbi:hypothetical protein [Aquiflexum lacus]|uniref:hypothetical protein n=1 Tax=Aquiflexum lacus TaxID=2483805 RepID=UPI00189318C4|nr:hypothetical protein [Aquiflexum lacus]
MRIILMIFSAFLALKASAQNEVDTVLREVKGIKLDLLKTPTNPSFQLMNSSATEIIEPGMTPEFFTSIQNASNNFTSLPNNLAIAFTPFWWGKQAKNLSFEKDFSETNRLNFARTLTVSAGMLNGVQQDQSLSRFSFGFQSTLLRGKVDGVKKDIYFNMLQSIGDRYFGEQKRALESDPQYLKLEAESFKILDSLRVLSSLEPNDSINEETLNSTMDSLEGDYEIIDKQLLELRREISEKIKTIESSPELDKLFNSMNERYGFKWDLGGGLAFNTTEFNLNNTGIYRIGLWTNFGGNLNNLNSGNTRLSLFFLTRYFYFKEILYESENNLEMIPNLHTIDMGTKLQLHVAGKFSVAAESVFRSDISQSIFENTYKINGIVQYQFGKNRVLYSSFGNDFNDNSNFGPQNLIITFGVNLGFGEDIDLKGMMIK